jgi:hypothetical protein
MPLKDRYPTNGSSRKALPRKVAQAAAKKSWQNRDLPNWCDRVDDLLKGKQILAKNLREVNALYVAARRKGAQTRRFKLSNAQFAVVAQGQQGLVHQIIPVSWKLKYSGWPAIACPTIPVIKEADLQDPRAGLKKGVWGE